MKRGAISLFRDTLTAWWEDKASRLAAALAFYAILAIAPLLLVAIGVIGFIFGPAAAHDQIVGQVEQLVGPQVAQSIQSLIASAHRPGAGTLATIIGTAALLLAAFGILAQLQDALNTIWEVQLKPGRGLRRVIVQRLLSYAVLLLTGLLLLLSLLASTALFAVARYFHSYLPKVGFLWQLINFVVSLLVVTLLFASIFKVLPDVRIRWRDVWIGAAFSSLLFNIGKLLLGLYLGRSSITSSYGAAGSLVLLLLWIYYSAQIFFFGAEFTQAYAHRAGTAIQPSALAVPLTEQARVQQGIPHRQGGPAAGKVAGAAHGRIAVYPATPVLPILHFSCLSDVLMLLAVFFGVALAAWQWARKMGRAA